MFLFLTVCSKIGWAGCVTLAWDPSDGPNLAGYVVYYGLHPRQYQWSVSIDTSTTYELCGLDEGIRYYFAVTAFDTEGRESDYSNEVSTVILSSPSCDINGDNVADAADIQTEINVVLGTETDSSIVAAADLDGDGTATVTDLQLLVNCILGK
jgi:hypothetical protein